MMKQWLKYVLPVLFAGIVLHGAELGDSALLATVDGEAITLGDVVRESGLNEAVAARTYSAAELPAEVEKMRREAVDRLIDRKLYVREFQRLNLTMPSEYVERLLDEVALNFGCKSRNELARKAREAGISVEILREKAAARIMADMVIGRTVYTLGEPSPREIYEYFKAHESEYSQPERINPALLLLAPGTTPEKVQEVQAKLTKEPDAFADMVRAFSVGPNREQGGVVGFLLRGTIRSEFQAVLPPEGLRKGMILGPVTTPEGIYFVRIVELENGHRADLNAHKEEIRAKLVQEAESAAIRKLTDRLRKEASIHYYFGPEAVKSVAAAPAEKKTESVAIAPAAAPAAPDGKSAAVPGTAQAAPAAPHETIQPAAPETPPASQAIHKTEKKTMVTLKTNFGDIKLELYPQYAPKTVANFLEYVKSGFYNGTLFHRVINDFMIQGGGFDQKFRQKATREPIENEADNRISNETGTIAMARTSDPHSATAQFFINVADNDFLDFRSPSPQFYGYCVFGKVVEGMDVVNKIKVVKTGGRGGHQDVPKEDVVILEAVAEE